MKSELKGLLTTVLLVGAFGVFAHAARPEQNALRTMSKETAETPSRTKPEAVKLNKSVSLAKNTGTNTGSTAPSVAAKPQAKAEKKTIGRCWKRLMGMAREIRHAHTKSNQ